MYGAPKVSSLATRNAYQHYRLKDSCHTGNAHAVRDVLMSVFAKCERAKRKFKEEGLWTDVVYYKKERENGSYVDMPLADSDNKETADFCVVMCDDKKLNEDLAKVEKYGGAWSTASSFRINRDSIDDADITINQASCRKIDVGESEFRMRDLSLLDLVGAAKKKNEPVGNTCRVTDLHVHNGRSPASHLHVECNNSTIDTIDSLTDIILEGNIFGNQLCEEGRYRRKEVGAFGTKRHVMF